MGGAVCSLRASSAVIVDGLVGWTRACEESVSVMAGSREANDSAIKMGVGTS